AHGIDARLKLLADAVLRPLETIVRAKYEHMITELVHQRDVVRRIQRSGANASDSFAWLQEMRYYWLDKKERPQERLEVRIADAAFTYGFEYLGVAERIIQTPLTDQCYLTLTQALQARMGGSPFGPAGTGKTETAKALGSMLGRFVLVFCCDENFDFQAMGRIFVGLCQCGAFGVFDEFNRLEERILSAVSQQIQAIQVALREKQPAVDLLGRSVRLHPDMGIFVTMNPGYAGRSNLPDNLKQLFRGIAMISPDRELIAQVMLYSQGFRDAEYLAGKIVPLFKLCAEQLSQQGHYDFGLRALKSVLVSSGNMKRQESDQPHATDAVAGDGAPADDAMLRQFEEMILLRSICENVIPKLVAEDIALFQSLLGDVFPKCVVESIRMDALRRRVVELCHARRLVPSAPFVEKMLQLYKVQELRHGVMLVGPSGSGKSASWETLLEAMEHLDGVPGQAHQLDPKAVSKDELFGVLDATTREWTDGLFTALLRRIIDNQRGESGFR
ncbi:MAG TPA: AAA family ATPase, partial [archaeon]|nr:AAA family ATPase [archaeon]